MKGIKIVVSLMLIGVACTGCNLKGQSEKGNLTADKEKEWDRSWKQDVVQNFNNLLVQDTCMYKESIYDENHKVLEKKQISGSEIKETDLDIKKYIIYEAENEKIEINEYENDYLYQSTYINNIQDYLTENTNNAEVEDLEFMSTEDAECEIEGVLEYAGVETKGTPIIKVINEQYYNSLNSENEMECYVFSFEGKEQEKIQVIYGENGILGLRYYINYK